MKCRKPIILLLAFIAICCVGDLFFTHVIIYGTSTSNAGRIYHLYQDNPDEIPIFGSSKAMADYNPSELGPNTFNYGIAAASFDVTDVMLQIELAKHKTTPIIVDILPSGIHTIGDEINYIPYVTDSRFRNLLKQHQAMSWRYYLPGIRYFGYYDWCLRDFLLCRIHLTTQNIRGYNYLFGPTRFDQTVFNGLVAKRLPVPVGYYPDADQDRRLLAHITGHPERLFILVYSPNHSSCYARFEHEDKFETYNKKLKALPNVVLIDWGRLDYPDKFFSDTTHLNKDGATDFSRKLGAQIREILRGRKQAANAPAAHG